MNVETLFLFFQNLVPLSNPLGGASHYPMERVIAIFNSEKKGGKGDEGSNEKRGNIDKKERSAKKEQREETSRELRRYLGRLESGLECFLSLLSAATDQFFNTLYESGRHQDSGRPSDSGGDRGNRGDGHTGKSATRPETRTFDMDQCLEVLLGLVEQGARGGTKSFQRILRSGDIANTGNSHINSGSRRNNSDSSDSDAGLSLLLSNVVADVLFSLASPLLGDTPLSALPPTFINGIKLKGRHGGNGKVNKYNDDLNKIRGHSSSPEREKERKKEREKENEGERVKKGTNEREGVGRTTGEEDGYEEAERVSQVAGPSPSPSSLFMNTLQYNLREVCSQGARTLKVYGLDDKNDNDISGDKSLLSEDAHHPKITPVLVRLIRIFISINEFRRGCCERRVEELSAFEQPTSAKKRSEGQPPSPGLGRNELSAGYYSSNRRKVHDKDGGEGSTEALCVEEEKSILRQLSKAQIKGEVKENIQKKKSEMKTFIHNISSEDTSAGSGRAVLVLCGVPLPRGHDGAFGAQKMVETILYRMKQFHKMLRRERTAGSDLKSKNKSDGVATPTAQMSNAGGRSEKHHGDERNIRVSVAHPAVDYVSSDEDDRLRDSKYSKHRHISPISEKKSSRSSPIPVHESGSGKMERASSYDRLLQSVLISLSDTEGRGEGRGGGDSGVGGGSYSREGDNRNNDDRHNRNKSAALGRHLSHPEGHEGYWGNGFNGDLEYDMPRYRDILVRHLIALNARAVHRREALSMLLEYRGLLGAVTKRKTASKDIDIEYIISNVNTVKNDLVLESGGTLDPEVRCRLLLSCYSIT